MPLSTYNKSLPRRFRRLRVVIAGCGDIGLRLIAQRIVRHGDRIGVTASARRDAQLEAIRALGARPLRCDLEVARDRARLAAQGRHTIYLAPPPNAGEEDRCMRGFAAALGAAALRRGIARTPGTAGAAGVCAFAPRLVYASTSGVYGDCAGKLIDETRPVAPASARARSRVDAERRVRTLARRGVARGMILRVPGIYAAERLPVQRLQSGLPAIRADEDGYTNHIHADDLAMIAWLALFRGAANRIYHASDSVHLKMGEWFDQVADATGVPRAVRLPRDQVRAAVSPMMWSFMRESRRLTNRRMLAELRVHLRYPGVSDCLRTLGTRAPESPL